MTDQTVAVLQLVKRLDADNSDINSVDLLGLPTELQYQGWQQGLPQPNKASIDEVVTLLMNAGNYNTLATSLQSIDTKIKETEWAQDPLNPVGVWLRARMTGETGARQSFITKLSRPQKGLEITNPLAYRGIVPNYGLGITRMPTWENLLATQIPASPGSITIHGGKIAYTVAGDAPARIAKIKISSATDGFNETWIGIKSDRYGVNPSNFVSAWYLHLGHLNTSDGDTSSASDTTALDGVKAVCDFALFPTMTFRTITAVSAITANVSDQRGRYTVLLRAKATSTLVVNIRVGSGYLQTAGGVYTPYAFSFKPRYQVSSSSAWNYYTLGEVKIPASSVTADLPIGSAAIGIQAEKVSGSGNLEMDSLILIPAESSNHVFFSAPGGYGSNIIDLYLLTRPDNKNSSISYYSSLNTITNSPPPDAVNWALPPGSGVIVFAGNSSIGNDKTGVFTPTLYVYPSYASLRGAS